MTLKNFICKIYLNFNQTDDIEVYNLIDLAVKINKASNMYKKGFKIFVCFQRFIYQVLWQ